MTSELSTATCTLLESFVVPYPTADEPEPDAELAKDAKLKRSRDLVRLQIGSLIGMPLSHMYTDNETLDFRKSMSKYVYVSVCSHHADCGTVYNLQYGTR